MFQCVRKNEATPHHVSQPCKARMFRHGESESNAGLPTKCSASPKITEVGRAQALAIAQQMAQPPSLFVVSPYVRTIETAAPALERYPQVPLEEWPIQEFTYLSGARYNGSTKFERAAAVEEYWLRSDPDYRDGNDSETFSEFLTRIDAFLQQLAALPNLEIAAFTHGHFLRGLMMVLQYVDAPVGPGEAMREYGMRWRHLPIENGEEFLLLPAAKF